MLNLCVVVDAFVKVTMTCRGQKISKKKTSIKYNTSSPVFNEAMTFDVPQHIVEEVSIIVNVLHHSRCETMHNLLRFET